MNQRQHAVVTEAREALLALSLIMSEGDPALATVVSMEVFTTLCSRMSPSVFDELLVKVVDLHKIRWAVRQAHRQTDAIKKAAQDTPGAGQ